MTPAERAREIFDKNRFAYGRMPRFDAESVCPQCLGPKSVGYYECGSCTELFRFTDCPAELQMRVVPMTTVLNDSFWYSAVLNYKKAQWREYASVVAVVPFLWLAEHDRELTTMLGGPPEIITIVPSKDPAITFQTQPLRKLLVHHGDIVQQTLVAAPNARELYDRRRYVPQMFEPAGVAIAGRRVVVVEDTWTTGATAISACGALHEAGARSIVLTPIARLINRGYVQNDHPYLAHLVGDYDLRFWPRE